MDFLSEIAVPSSNAVPETPKGLSNIQTELAQLATIFGRVCGMNRMVFAEFYCHTIKQMLESSTGPLTPGRSQQIDDLSRSPESPNRSPRSPVTSGLTPRKGKRSMTKIFNKILQKRLHRNQLMTILASTKLANLYSCISPAIHKYIQFTPQKL